MKKIFLVMLLVTAFIVGCGKKSADGNVIKIGVISPLTGNYAQYGTAVKEGVELKVDAINNAGGINGKKIELVIASNIVGPVHSLAWFAPRQKDRRLC